MQFFFILFSIRNNFFLRVDYYCKNFVRFVIFCLKKIGIKKLLNFPEIKISQTIQNQITKKGTRNYYIDFIHTFLALFSYFSTHQYIS
jgi:hypothetical protein